MGNSQTPKIFDVGPDTGFAESQGDDFGGLMSTLDQPQNPHGGRGRLGGSCIGLDKDSRGFRLNNSALFKAGCDGHRRCLAFML